MGLEVLEEGGEVWLVVVLEAVPHWVVHPRSTVLVAQGHLGKGDKGKVEVQVRTGGEAGEDRW